MWGDDPPENCHLNEKNGQKLVIFFSKNLPKIVFFLMASFWLFFDIQMATFRRVRWGDNTDAGCVKISILCMFLQTFWWLRPWYLYIYIWRLFDNNVKTLIEIYYMFLFTFLISIWLYFESRLIFDIF